MPKPRRGRDHGQRRREIASRTDVELSEAASLTVREQVVDLVATVRAAIARVAETADVDAVHGARVALRTLAVVELLVPSYGPPRAWTTLRRDLGKHLAAVRDLDVAALRGWADELAEARRRAAEGLSVPAWELAQRLASWELPARGPSTLRLGLLWSRWERALERATTRATITELHRLRRVARELRLGTLVVEPLAPATSARLRRSAQRLSTHLGQAHDVIVVALAHSFTRSASQRAARDALRLARGWESLAHDLDRDLGALLTALRVRCAHDERASVASPSVAPPSHRPS